MCCLGKYLLSPFSVALEVFHAALMVAGDKLLKKQISLVKRGDTDHSTFLIKCFPVCIYWNLDFYFCIFIQR